MYSNWCHEPMSSIYATWKPSNSNGIYFYFMNTLNDMLNCIQGVYIRKGSYQLTRHSQQQITGHNVTCSELAVCIRWPKYWSFSFSISLCNEYSGFISFRIDWFDLLIVQESSLAQFESINSSALFLLYRPTLTSIPDYWKDHSLNGPMDICWQSDVFAFNVLSRFVYSFSARSNHLISWLQSPSPLILELKKRKSVTASTFSPSICHEVMGCHDLQFSLVTQLGLILCDPMECSIPGFPVNHQLPELAQSHIHVLPITFLAK